MSDRHVQSGPGVAPPAARDRPNEENVEALRTELARLEGEARLWRERFEKLSDESRENIGNVEGQIAQARENIEDLARQVEGARAERARLVEEIEYWSAKAATPFRNGWKRVVRRSRARLKGEDPDRPIGRAITDGRKALSLRYLRGEGLEIGALHTPTPIPAGASVRYLDRMSRGEQRATFPELRDFDFVAVDLIDDGETLDTVADDSLDFLIASHVLEHCENPLGTLRNHLRKVKPGGVLFYVIPDRRTCFDADRPLTTFEHLVRDDQEGPHVSRREHYLEYSRLVDRVEDEAAIVAAADQMEMLRTNIHFHVWEEESNREMWHKARAYFDEAFEIETMAFNFVETIAVLRRTGSP